jgi:hypothetical protein
MPCRCKKYWRADIVASSLNSSLNALHFQLRRRISTFASFCLLALVALLYLNVQKNTLYPVYLPDR